MKKFLDSTVAAVAKTSAEISRLCLQRMEMDPGQRQQILSNISKLEGASDIEGLGRISAKLAEMAIPGAVIGSPAVRPAEKSLDTIEDLALYPDEKERELHKALRATFARGPIRTREMPIYVRQK